MTGERDTTADGSGLKDKNVATEIIWSAKRHTDSYLDSDVMTPSNNTLEMLALSDGVMFSKAVITSEGGVVVYIIESMR